MNPLRIGTALTALGMIGALAACSTPGARIATRSSSLDAHGNSNVGLATKAQVALEKGDVTNAIDLAERAVAGTPDNAAFRMLLGHTYFAGGRFASAEQAYRDSLSLSPAQPQVVLKLALVMIAQGKDDQAVALLAEARSSLDPADFGLALALAGHAPDAVMVLDSAARQPGADARVRQNLALAHALTGDWTMAKAVASQDLTPDQIEARLQQWMRFAKPNGAADQVAALTGVTPAAMDPGQPVRLALNTAEPAPTMLASAEAPAAPAVEAQPTVAYAPAATYAPAEIPAPPVESAPAPVEAAPVVAAMPLVAAAAMPTYVPVPAPAAQLAPVAIDAPAAPVLTAKIDGPKPRLSPRAARLSPLPAVARGSSSAVVQLGAFSSRSNVSAAWNRYSARFSSLRGYEPSTARFVQGGDTLYRLSVSGFASTGDAQRFCTSLKQAGGKCFVRNVAGDRPVEFASR